MKILLRSTLFLIIVLSVNLPLAFSMIRIGEGKPNEKQGSTSQQQTARRETEESDEDRELRLSAHTERGAAATTRDQTYDKGMEGEESLNDAEEPSPITMPVGFSEASKRLLQETLKRFSPGVLRQYHSGLRKPSKQMQSIIDQWETEGISIDPECVDRAIATRKRVQAMTAEANAVEANAEKAFDKLEEGQYYAAAMHLGDQFIEAAIQVRDAWIETAAMYQRIPGRQWGIRLKETWARKVDECQQQQEEIQQDFLKQVEKIASEATASITKFRKIGAALMQEKKYSEAARLSDAYEKIIIAQRALPSPLPKERLSMVGAINLELGLESLKTAMFQAELRHHTMIGSGIWESDIEERTSNESSSAPSASAQGKLSIKEIEEEKSNHAFRRRVAALEIYATKTLETADDCFTFFTSGGEFADETDTNDLSAAYDGLETAAWVLNVLKIRIVNGDQDSVLQQEKEKTAIRNLEKAIEEVHIIAARIGNEEVYEQDKNTAKILANLQKAKEEYQTTLQNEK